MKLKTSLFNKAIAKRNLTGHISLWAGLLVFWLLMLTFNVYARLKTYLYMTNLDELTAEDILNMKVDGMLNVVWEGRGFFIPAFAVIAVIVAMVSFSYLFTSRNANMVHTFPVNRISLFCTNYLTGLLYLIVPVVIGILLSLIVGASMGAVTGLVVSQYLLWLGTAVVEIIFFFSMSVCMLMFSGNIIAVPVFYTILNYLYAGCMLIIEAMIDSVCYGVSANVTESIGYNMLTPIAYMPKHIYSSCVSVDSRAYKFFGAKALAGYLAAAIVFVVIALIAYQKKQIETAGDIITVGWFKPVFRWGSAVCFSALGAVFFTEMTYQRSFATVILCGTLIGIVVFFVAQMLIDRSLRVFTKKKIMECVIYTVCLCSVYIGLDADVLGIERRVPNADEIQTASVSGWMSFYAESADEIAWVQDVHSQIVASRKEFQQNEKNGYEDTCYVSIRYKLKNGGSLERFYHIPTDAKQGSVWQKIEECARRPDVIFKGYFGIHYPDIEVTGAYLEKYEENAGMVSTRISEAEANQLYQAMRKDVEAGNFARTEDGMLKETDETVDEMMETYLTFEVHDRQGYVTPESLHYGYDTNRYGAADTNRTEEIWLDSEYTNLVKALRKLGYLEKK